MVYDPARKVSPAAIVPALLLGGPRPISMMSGPQRRTFLISDALRVCWLSLFAVSLLGYAVLSKGWAYVGYPPFFIGEILLLSGVFVFLTCTAWWAVFEVPITWPLLALMAWGAARTIPYLSTYKVDALRDAVVWGYATFAFILCGFLVSVPWGLPRLLHQYRTLVRVFLVGVPIVTIVSMAGGASVPRWPGTDTPIVYSKGGDVLVHLGGILAFWSAGLYGGPVTLPLAMLFMMNVAIMGIQSRGGLLSFLAGFAMCAIDRPRSQSLRVVVIVTVCGFVGLAATNLKIPVPGRERSISFEQFLENISSISSESNAGDLDGTKQWRLNWWATIVSYTFYGDHFWKGKGFGINLADDDGFQVAEDKSLRSPHNGHLTILARTGVPGLCLWALAQLGWACSIFFYFLKSRLRRHDDWSGLFLGLLVYWTGFMINATFDVFIEGPMGGIWFWSIYGIGMAGMWIYRRDPGRPLRLEDRAPSPGRRTVNSGRA